MDSQTFPLSLFRNDRIATSSTSRDKTQEWDRWILLASAIVAVPCFLLRLGIHLVSANYNLAAEANGLHGILEAAQGHVLYPSLSSAPYYIYLYPPLQAMVTAVSLQLTQISSVHGQVMMARFFSFAALILTLRLVWEVCKTTRVGSRSAFALAILLFLPKVCDYATTTRNDMWFLCFELACAALFLLKPHSVKRIALCALIAVLSVFVRQTGISTAAAIGLWLLFRREWSSVVLFSAIYLFGLAVGIGVTWITTGGAVWSHVILANIRGWRPINGAFFDASLLSFFGSYIVFALLTALGCREAFVERRRPLLFLGLCAATSFAVAVAVFMRAGGDVNYFFLPMLFAVPFVTLAIDHWQRRRTVWRLLIFVQISLSSAVVAVKAHSAWKVAFLDYAGVANEIRRSVPAFGHLIGGLAPNMNIHLRGWAYHGPDVSNASEVAYNAHDDLRWLARDLRRAALDRRVRSVVIADTRCPSMCPPSLEAPFANFTEKRCWAPWLCSYTQR